MGWYGSVNYTLNYKAYNSFPPGKLCKLLVFPGGGGGGRRLPLRKTKYVKVIVSQFDFHHLKMVGWNKETKKRIQVVLSAARTSFYYGFIPVIIYLGI